MLEMDGAEEKDVDGNTITGGKKKHSFNNFASQDFTFSPTKTVVYQGAECTNINFTGTLADVGADLSIELYLVHNDSVEFESGNETFTAIKGALKFNIVVGFRSWRGWGLVGGGWL